MIMCVRTALPRNGNDILCAPVLYVRNDIMANVNQ